MYCMAEKQPTIEEIAAKLELPREEIVVAMEAIIEPVSDGWPWR